MKLNSTPRINVDAATAQWYREIAAQVNGLSEGSIAAFYNAATAAPTTGTWAKGDTIKNASPVEAGSAGSKYVVEKFICVASGTPGTWLQMRSLTGN